VKQTKPTVIPSEATAATRAASAPLGMSAFCLVLSHLLAMTLPVNADDRPSAIIAVGAGGEAEYATAFAKWAGRWQQACEAGDVRATTIGLDEHAPKSLEQLRSALRDEPKESAADLWIVLLGHGTATTGSDAKFNLAGDDLSASELAALLAPFHRPVVIVAGFSASGAFLAPLSASGRVIVTATKAGAEHNYARFGGYLSDAIGDPAADLDHDGQTSVLEAWLTAAQRVASFYKDEGRLATEHSLLDDNGDGKGTPADFYRGVRVVKKAKDGTPPDGVRAGQIHLVRNAEERALPSELRAKRDALELELAKLRDAKATMPEDAYYRELEALLLKIARLYEDSHANAD
jgi:hypothetical protein